MPVASTSLLFDPLSKPHARIGLESLVVVIAKLVIIPCERKGTITTGDLARVSKTLALASSCDGRAMSRGSPRQGDAEQKVWE